MLKMTDAHQLFLQSFISRGILDGRQVKDLYKFVCEKYKLDFDVSKLAEFTLLINSSIRPYHMEIKKGIDEHDGTNFYCLVNLEESDISRLASRYSPVELEYFMRIMEEVVSNGAEGSLSSTDALNLTEEMKSKVFRKRDAEAVIEKLCGDKWLAKKDGQILLTPRTLMEFDHYIQEQYPDDSVQCEMCHKLVVKGHNCSQCPIRMHIHCAKRFFSMPESPRCPSCSEAWSHDISTPVKVPKTADDTHRESRPSRDGRRACRR